jgi:hypothetical protein
MLRAIRYESLVRTAKAVESRSTGERIAADEIAQHAWRGHPDQVGRKFAAQCVARVDGGKVCGRDYFAAVHTAELPAARA